MKTVVITGSARGLGLEMAKEFKKNNYNVVICDINKENLLNAYKLLENIKSDSKVGYCVVDVTKSDEVNNLIKYTEEEFQNIDIWINNAGVNQPNKPVWELSENEIDGILDIDLKGTIMGCKLVIPKMIKQGYGSIYNIEGYGSNDAKMLGLSLYGTSKRAITYFTESLAKECEELNTNIIVGKLSPGIMITDFLTNALGNKEKISLSDKTKKVYNILGDYPTPIAKFLVDKMINNTKNNVKIEWLTNRKAFLRFMFSSFNKRDFFKEGK